MRPGKVTRPADLCCGTGQNPCCETYSGPSSPRHDVDPQGELWMFGINGHGIRLRGREWLRYETSTPEPAQTDYVFYATAPLSFP